MGGGKLDCCDGIRSIHVQKEKVACHLRIDTNAPTTKTALILALAHHEPSTLIPPHLHAAFFVSCGLIFSVRL